MAGMLKRIAQKILRMLGYELRSYHRFKSFTQSPARLADFEGRLAVSPVKLHFGCGARVLKGWINIDLRFVDYDNYLVYFKDEHYPPEIRGTSTDLFVFDVIRGPLPIPQNTVDVIFHEDFLEHLTQRDQVLFLAETWRILKPGGVHRINTPNLLSSMRDHSSFENGYRGVYVQEWNKHRHFSVLTPLMLEELARMVGYREVHFNGRNRSVSSLIPKEYRPDPNDRPEDGNLFVDLIK